VKSDELKRRAGELLPWAELNDCIANREEMRDIAAILRAVAGGRFAIRDDGAWWPTQILADADVLVIGASDG
jgi:hypothetical protein